MKVALGNLGPLTYALKDSLEVLGIEAVYADVNNRKMLELGSLYLPVEMCFPLKLLLGNYLSVIDSQADALIYFSGCDMCNLTPVTMAYTEILNERGWFPEVHHCSINSKKDFLFSYVNTLKKLSNKSWFEIFLSIRAGMKKYESFHFLDQVFYNIRPAFDDAIEAETIYQGYFNKLIHEKDTKIIDGISAELFEMYSEYSKKLPSDVLKVGLVGDSFSLIEPYTHQYVDKQLGNEGVVVDRWTAHRLTPKEYRRIQDKSDPSSKTLAQIIQNKYGAMTAIELKKLSRYINRGYDGIVFISPLECNPNDALRNLLTSVQQENGIPILSMVFDEHTSPLGIKVRIEAFVDMLNKRKRYKPANAVNF
jgi:predicted nucleotide-binding protein (sugar kinase/HSP70/actin superfamily)